MKILNAFRKIVGIQSQQAEVDNSKFKQSGTVRSTPSYPPADEGIPLVPLREVIESQAELLTRIKLSSGMKQEDYRAFMVPVIERFVRYAHLLPATKNQHHRGAGGMLRLGLETAFYSMQAADGVIFAGLESTERKRDMEERWRYATFLTGLCMDLYRIPNSMVITSANGLVLDPHEQRLYEWASKNEITRYYVKWSASEFKPASNSDLIANGPLMHMLMPPEAFGYLNATGNKPMNAMLATITGTVPNSEILTINKIVTEMRRKVIERDSALQPEMYGKLSIGVHIEPHIIDAMRRLISRNIWGINKPSARIWYGTDGMFILWRRDMAEEIVNTVLESKVQGFPAEPDSILDLMLKSSIVMSSANGGCFELNGSAASPNEKPKWRTVMRIANPDIFQGEGCSIEKAQTSFLATAKPKTQAKPQSPAKPESKASAPADQLKNATPVSSESNGEASARSNNEVFDEQLAQGNEGIQSEEEQQETEEAEQDVPAGYVQEVQEIDVPSSESAADKLLSVVPNSVADVMRAMAADYQSETTGFAWSKHGFCICYAKLITYGMNPMNIVQSLERTSWLVLDGTKKVHNIEIDGKQEMAIVLIPGIAERLGFSRQNGGCNE